MNKKTKQIKPSSLTAINVVVESDNNKSPANLKESEADTKKVNAKKTVKEFGGRGGLEPTRYGDWEKSGRCIDF